MRHVQPVSYNLADRHIDKKIRTKNLRLPWLQLHVRPQGLSEGRLRRQV